MPINSVDLEGKQPLSMIDKNGKLTKPMVVVLNAAFGYSKSSLEKTTWIHYQSNLYSYEWSIYTNIPEETSASVKGDQVIHDGSMTRSDAEWFGLIVHEQKHRQDVDNNDLFYVEYGIEGLLKDYYDISAEKRAYRYGSSYGSYADQFLQYAGGNSLGLLTDKTLSDGEKIFLLEGTASKFRRDVILKNQIQLLQDFVKDFEDAKQNIAKSNDLDWLEKAERIQKIDGGIKELNKKSDSLKNEQKQITDKYGN